MDGMAILTVFVLLWGACVYHGELAVTRLETRARARNCAWKIAMGACEEVFDDCQKQVKDGKDNEEVGGLSSAKEGEEANPSSETVDDTMKSAVSGSVLKRVDVSASAELDRPKLFGGETATVTDGLNLPCNIKPPGSAGNVTDTVFNQFSPPPPEEEESP